MFQKVLKQSFSLLMVIWGKHWITYRPQTVDLGLLIKTMFSRSVHARTKQCFAFTFRMVNNHNSITLPPGLRSAPSLACQKHGTASNWGKIRWCLCWIEAALWYGLFTNWYHYHPVSNLKELWYAWVFEVGIYEGSYNANLYSTQSMEDIFLHLFSSWVPFHS